MTVTPPFGPLRRRRLKQYERRALTLLVGCGSAGCQEAVMRTHGFTADQLAELVRIGFAGLEVGTLKITEAGQRALG